ncbi:MAG: tyrosine-type recombinase/integrase [Bryobacteraceae bacterium]|nr:tyrosine-type recombinase/integrase [Bryobacteraceae bacterium]
MRNIFVRHRLDCRYVAPGYKHPKGMVPRLIFGCGCPIYARLLVRHPDLSVAPFEFNGSLAKLGVREKLAAEDLIDQWTVQFLSGQNGKPDPHTFKTVEQAIEDYVEEKRGTLDANKESTKLTIQKIAGILRPLAPFLCDRGIVHLKDVKTEHLSVFQETWQGRLRKNRKSDGELVRQPKSQLGKQKNQEFVKMFFRRARELRWIPENPAELLLAVKTPRIEVKKKTPEEKQRLLEAIPRVFPNIAQAAMAFVLIQRYSGLRLVDVVTLRTDSLQEDGLMIVSQEKNEQPVFVPLPPFVIELVRKLPPKSRQYFFWTGTSTIKTAVNDWSEKMRQLYVEAGIEGKRTHEWRDTLAIEVLEGGGSLEDVQLLLGHKSRKTTEKYYVALTKKRMEKAIEARRRTWDADTVASTPLPALATSE